MQGDIDAVGVFVDGDHRWLAVAERREVDGGEQHVRRAVENRHGVAAIIGYVDLACRAAGGDAERFLTRCPLGDDVVAGAVDLVDLTRNPAADKNGVGLRIDGDPRMRDAGDRRDGCG